MLINTKDHKHLMILLPYQVHRKALGMISFGQCSNEDEFQELFESYKKEKEVYADSLYNSRLIVFGMNTDGSPIEEVKVQGDDSPPPMFRIDSKDSGIDTGITISESSEAKVDSDSNSKTRDRSSDSAFTDPLRDSTNSPKKNQLLNNRKTYPSDIQTSDKKDGNTGSQITFIRKSNSKPENKSLKVDKLETKKVEELKAPTSITRTASNNSMRDTPGSEVVFYTGVDNCDELEECVREFVTSLFYVLEGKINDFIH